MKQKVVNLSGVAFTFTALNLKELRELDSLLAESPGRQGLAGILRFVPSIHASLRKAHQSITQEQLESMLDLESFHLAFNAVLEASGLRKGEEGPATV